MAGGGLTAALSETCVTVGRAMRGAHDRWWIIGSAAVVLHGGDAGTVGDVDLLLSPRDARMLAETLGFVLAPGRPDSRFRSDLVGAWRGEALVVDVMANLAVAREGDWQPVRLATRLPCAVAGEIVHVPTRRELVALLELFGREKDLVRAAALAI